MQLINPYDWFFSSLWRRLLIIGVTLGWGLFEIYNDNQLWGMLFGGIGVYCAYIFYLNPIKNAPKSESNVDEG